MMEGECKKIVKKSLELGIRHIGNQGTNNNLQHFNNIFVDTAKFYDNEVEIGEAIRESKINRKDIFITSKLWIDQHG
jgi:hypothetical protein